MLPFSSMLRKEHWQHPWAATTCYSALVMMTSCSVNIVGPAGPTIAKNLEVGVKAIGTIFTAEGLGGMIGSMCVGTVINRAHQRMHSVVCVLCLTVLMGTGAVPACSSFYQVVWVYFVLGLAFGLLNGTANTLLTWVQRGSTQGLWINLVNAHSGMGGTKPKPNQPNASHCTHFPRLSQPILRICHEHLFFRLIRHEQPALRLSSLWASSAISATV